MQVSCPQCSAKLQLSAAKLPDHPFIIKCPKCECGFQVTPERQEEVLAVAASTPTPPPVETPAPPPAAASPESALPSQPEVSAKAASMVPPVSAPVMIAPPPSTTSTPPVSDSVTRPVSDLPIAAVSGMAAVGFTNSMPTPTAWDDSRTLMTPQNQGGNNDLLQALTVLLSGASGKGTAAIPQVRRRFVTACLSNQEAYSKVKTILGEREYFVTAAESPDQVTALLQSSHQLDILLLDPAFHSEQQGGASIMRYLNMLNPARRRRVFVVVVSQTYKTMDAQAAFSHGVNMIVNTNELEMLPSALSHSIGDFNNLYRAFNEASGIAPF